MKKTLLAMAFALFATPCVAGTKSVALSVTGMTCELCPITVKKALSRVPGVSAVSVDFEKREATVSFDDAKTTVEALTKATANAGYPSAIK